jgi:hypothetical protein
MNWSRTTAVDAQSFTMDGPNSWSAQNPLVEAILLEQYFSQSSLEAVPSPPLSVRTLVSEHPDEAQSAELHPSLSQMSFPNSSGHSDITDSSFNLPDTGFYPSSPYNTDSHAHSESTYADDINSSMRRGSFHNGTANGNMRRPGLLLPTTTGSSYPTLTSPEEVVLTSPMDITSQPMFENNAPRDDFSSSLDPLTINPNWRWDSAFDQGESGVSTPLSADGLWPAIPVTKTPLEYSSSPAGISPRYVYVHS